MNESINDKNLFKAVIMAGGPGSGKSFVIDKMFKGVAKIINPDKYFETKIKSGEISSDITDDGSEEAQKQAEIRKKSIEIMSKEKSMALDNMLPIVLDGTGRNSNYWISQIKKLQNLGYDVDMIFVNTSLDTALERNRLRDRKLSDKMVSKAWSDVQRNKEIYRSILSTNFHEVDNDYNLDGANLQKFNKKLVKLSNKIINKPLQNPTGKLNISKLKDIGGKKISDIEIKSAKPNFKKSFDDVKRKSFKNSYKKGSYKKRSNHKPSKNYRDLFD